METDVETPAQASTPAEPEAPRVPVALASPDLPADPPSRHRRGWRRWVLRLFVLTLLLAAAGTVAAAAITIVGDVGDNGRSSRKAINGVLMPDDAHYRDITNQLLARKRPEKLRGLTIVGDEGKVKVIRYKAGAPSLLSSYLNPNALSVIARAISVRSNATIIVDELRLEVLRRTGRQRWRLHGTQDGKTFRATIKPNGTNLRLIPSKAS